MMGSTLIPIRQHTGWAAVQSAAVNDVSGDLTWGVISGSDGIIATKQYEYNSDGTVTIYETDDNTQGQEVSSLTTYPMARPRRSRTTARAIW